MNLKQYSTWAIILLPILTMLSEQLKLVDLGPHGTAITFAIGVIIAICRAIPQAVTAIEASEDASKD